MKVLAGRTIHRDTNEAGQTIAPYVILLAGWVLLILAEHFVMVAMGYGGWLSWTVGIAIILCIYLIIAVVSAASFFLSRLRDRNIQSTISDR